MHGKADVCQQSTLHKEFLWFWVNYVVIDDSCCDFNSAFYFPSISFTWDYFCWKVATFENYIFKIILADCMCDRIFFYNKKLKMSSFPHVTVTLKLRIIILTQAVNTQDESCLIFLKAARSQKNSHKHGVYIPGQVYNFWLRASKCIINFGERVRQQSAAHSTFLSLLLFSGIALKLCENQSGALRIKKNPSAAGTPSSLLVAHMLEDTTRTTTQGSKGCYYYLWKKNWKNNFRN